MCAGQSISYGTVSLELDEKAEREQDAGLKCTEVGSSTAQGQASCTTVESGDVVVQPGFSVSNAVRGSIEAWMDPTESRRRLSSPFNLTYVAVFPCPVDLVRGKCKSSNDTVVDCPFACDGADVRTGLTNCSDAYAGVLCANCAPGFGRRGSMTTPCKRCAGDSKDDDGLVTISIVSLLCLAVFVFAVDRYMRIPDAAGSSWGFNKYRCLGGNFCTSAMSNV